MKRWLLTLLCVIATFPLSAQGRTALHNQPIEKVDIQIEGHDVSVTPAYVRTKLKTKPGDRFSQLTFDDDLKTLAKEFDRIDPQIQLQKGKVFITLVLHPKPTIRTVRFYGNESQASSSLKDELAIQPGSTFDRSAFNQSFSKLKQYYIKKGFFEATLSYDVEYDDLTNQVDLVITVSEGHAGKIKEIKFVNFTDEEQEELFEQLHTKKYNMFLSWWYNNDGIYAKEMIQQDEYQIINYLQNQGYADAFVEIDLEESKKGTLTVTITAQKGARYQFGIISFSGNTIFSDEEISKHLGLCEGAWYSPETVRCAIESVTDLYGAKGYIDAFIDEDIHLSDQDPTYTLHLNIHEGNQYRVGLIKIFGNCSTRNEVILHETLLCPGEVFNNCLLKKTEQRLSYIGYFSHVNVFAVDSESSCLGEGYRDVHIELEETSTGSFQAFLGASSSENVFFGFSITENNFDHRGIANFPRTGFPGMRGGGEYAHMTTQFGLKSRSYLISWSKPYFMDTCWVVGFDLDQTNNRYTSKRYDIDAYGLTLHARRPLNPYLRLTTHARIRDSRVQLHNISGLDPDLRSQLEETRDASAPIVGLGAGLVYDSCNRPRHPSSGLRSSLLGEYAWILEGGAFSTVGYYNSYYIPAGKCGVLKLRADAKFIFPLAGAQFNDIPLDERIYLGGDTLVRGYDPYKLGPKFTGTDDPRGGISLALFSIEYAHTFNQAIEGFVFFDSGQISDNSLTIGWMYSSYGVGLRLSLLPSMPPVTIGYGIPVNTKTPAEEQRFFFSAGATF